MVKLFNAIRTQQKVTEVAVQEATVTRGTQLAKEKAKNGKNKYMIMIMEKKSISYLILHSKVNIY